MKKIKSYSSTHLLSYSATQLLIYSSTDLLSYSATDLLSYSATDLLSYSATQLLSYALVVFFMFMFMFIFIFIFIFIFKKQTIYKSLLNNFLGRFGLNFVKPITEILNREKRDFILNNREVFSHKELKNNIFLRSSAERWIITLLLIILFVIITK